MLLHSILDLYEHCSGQVKNKDKSVVLFIHNANEYNREELKQELQIGKETMNEKYLGWPAHVGRSKGGAFAYVKERIWQRIQGWKQKMISRAGLEINIKAVALLQK